MEPRNLGIRIDGVRDSELREHSERALVVIVLSTATVAACTALLVSLL
jgi:hypothetical protein